MAFPQLIRHTETDSEESFTTPGWISRVYKLSNEPLRFLKKSLQFSDGLLLTEVQLQQGNLRNVAEIEPGRLTIGFYRKEEEFIVSGAAVKNYVMSVAYNGSKWDINATAPGFSLSVHLAPEAARAIISQNSHDLLMKRLTTPAGMHAIVFPITAAGEELRHAIDATLQLADSDDAQAASSWVADDLMALTACVIDEVTDLDAIATPRGQLNRHKIALEIERILWSTPNDEAPAPSSLDEFAAHFDCSRRYIQQSVEEQFGVGFVVLKRFIRLHQVYIALTTGAHDGKLSSVAIDYEFEHLGRFSRYFQEMFGRKPSSLAVKAR